MNAKRIAVAITIPLMAAAWQRHETPIAGGYGSGVVTSNIKIREEGKSISLSDVHPGDGASVQGSRVDASTVLAQTIEVHSSGH